MTVTHSERVFECERVIWPRPISASWNKGNRKRMQCFFSFELNQSFLVWGRQLWPAPSLLPLEEMLETATSNFLPGFSALIRKASSLVRTRMRVKLRQETARSPPTYRRYSPCSHIEYRSKHAILLVNAKNKLTYVFISHRGKNTFSARARAPRQSFTNNSPKSAGSAWLVYSPPNNEKLLQHLFGVSSHDASSPSRH